MNTLDAFRFAEPDWAMALWVVGFAVVVLLWLDQRGSRALDRLVSPVLQQHLVSRPRRLLRLSRIALLGLAASCVVLALMRPQGEMHTVKARQSGAELMIALDVSNSMLAEDVAPNRLERAKAEIVDLLDYLEGDQVGLIAFAGRASLISPLTPDFGFVRLALSEVGPGSAARGGTRLEEPIRKAVAGFARPGRGALGSGSRALVLITDGEDHGSFPLDAAEAAAQAGIVVIAIGIGDEDGSEIRITNPQSGVREILRDANGNPVRTRLDGELLRAIASETGGAYVPAGTASLDLESIYREHIGPMTRGRLDTRGRTVREELYPWFVLLGLAFLVASVGVGALPPRPSVAATLLIFGLIVGATGEGRAQATDAPNPEFSSEPDVSEPELTPRERFNRGVSALEARDFDEAISDIERAREEAGGDAELRFRATYDLGWLAVQQSGRTEGENPRAALEELYRAVDWFREALALQPEDDDTRENLEVAQLRALKLEDRLARQGDGGFEEQLDELIQRERTLLEAVSLLYRSTAAALAAGDPNATDALRSEFRAQSSAQRLLLADANVLANRIGGERDALSTRPAQEREPTDEMRAVQLGNALHYLHRAQERMGKARSQLRRRQGAMAYRQASGALSGLKRARDQFREPVAIIDALLADQGGLSERTHQLMSARQEIVGSLPVAEEEKVLAAEQNSLAGRAGELDARLRSVFDGASDVDSGPSATNASQEAALRALREASPFVDQAHQRLLEAGEDLDKSNLQGAQVGQYEGLRALGEARERFLDLRGLIEAAHADEVRIVEILSQLEDADDVLRREYLYSLRGAQTKNLDRTVRMAAQIDAKQRELSQPPAASPGADAPDPEQLRQELQRMDAARDILGRVQAGMTQAQAQLNHAATWEKASGAANVAVEELENLRRLFFSIVEHIREALRQQIELGDRTRDAAAHAAGSPDAAVALAYVLKTSQAELAERTLSLANALVEQADLAPPDEPEAEQVSQILRSAAEHVVMAEMEMVRADEPLGLRPPEFSTALPFQQTAAEELAEAIALLAPPPPEENPEPPEESEQPQETESPEAQEPEAGDESQTVEPTLDPAQLLQAVRDQDAERRRERAARARSYDAVEKDW